MALTTRAARQRVGRELGIVLTGVATAATGTSLTDTSSDSPLDPGDVAERLAGAGIFIHVVASGVSHYRQNVTYVGSTQTISWTGSIASIAAGDAYEIHLEPILNPLTIWPDLVENALKTIKRISMQEILLVDTSNYYNLADWPDIDGPEQVRRLYDIGSNFLKNSELKVPVGASTPTDWTLVNGTIAESTATGKNYNVIQINAASRIRQEVRVQPGRRYRTVVLSYGVAAIGDLQLQVIRLDANGAAVGGNVAVNFPVAAGLVAQEVLTNESTVTLQVNIGRASSGASGKIAMPVMYDMSTGEMRRIQPMTTYLYDDEVRMYLPDYDSGHTVGRMALLLPYAVPTDDGATVVSASLSDRLLIAALAVQVLRWLEMHPELPDHAQYLGQAQIWSALFNKRHREHMRKIAKTQQRWEAGELTGNGWGYLRGMRR